MLGYTFKLEKYIFMYNHLLTITKGQKSYKAIIESAPTKEKTMLRWPDQLKNPFEEVDTLKSEITNWFAEQNVKCIFYDGKGR